MAAASSAKTGSRTSTSPAWPSSACSACRLTRSTDGSAYILDGVKLWTTNGPIAELLAVMATVPEHPGGPGGITAFIVEADSPGITVENRNRFLGLKGLENGVTHFHQVPVSYTH